MNWYYMHSNNFIPKNPNSVAVESGASTATLGGFKSWTASITSQKLMIN